MVVGRQPRTRGPISDSDDRKCKQRSTRLLAAFLDDLPTTNELKAPENLAVATRPCRMLLNLPFRRDPRPRGCRSRNQKSYLGGRPRCGVQPVRVASSFDPVAISNIDTDDTRGRRPADVEGALQSLGRALSPMISKPYRSTEMEASSSAYFDITLSQSGTLRSSPSHTWSLNKLREMSRHSDHAAHGLCQWSELRWRSARSAPPSDNSRRLRVSGQGNKQELIIILIFLMTARRCSAFIFSAATAHNGAEGTD